MKKGLIIGLAVIAVALIGTVAIYNNGKKKAEEERNNIVKNMNEAISNYENNLTDENSDAVLKLQAELPDDEYFDSYKKEWSKKIAELNISKIKTDAVKNLRTEDLINNPSKYKDSIIYSHGPVREVHEDNAIVGVGCMQHLDTKEYDCEYNMYVNFPDKDSVSVGNYVSFWGNIAPELKNEGSYTNMPHLNVIHFEIDEY